MTVDEILADVREGLGLIDEEVLVNVIVIGEYVTLDPDAEQPGRRRLAVVASEECEPWSVIGMLEFCKLREVAAVTGVQGITGDDDD